MYGLWVTERLVTSSNIIHFMLVLSHPYSHITNTIIIMQLLDILSVRSKEYVFQLVNDSHIATPVLIGGYAMAQLAETEITL